MIKHRHKQHINNNNNNNVNQLTRSMSQLCSHVTRWRTNRLHIFFCLFCAYVRTFSDWEGSISLDLWIFDRRCGLPGGQKIPKKKEIDFIFHIVVWYRSFECVTDSAEYIRRAIKLYHHQFDATISKLIQDLFLFLVIVQLWSIDNSYS
jgi:hypothetical protein